MSDSKELKSDFVNVFEDCRSRLIDSFSPEETSVQKAARIASFAEKYNKHVKITGRHVSRTWTMNHDMGFQVLGEYDISIRIHGWTNEKYHPYLKIAKSTLGEDSHGVVVDSALHRQSGFGVFAAKDFEAGEYIGPFLGDLKKLEKQEEEPQKKKRTTSKRKSKQEDYQSAYSLEILDELRVDAKGSVWNHWYFGLHLINDPRDKKKENIKVDEHLRFFALKKIKAGEELFLGYGRYFWRCMEKEL